MQELPRHTGVRGPALVRLLARLTDADVPEPRQLLSDRLSQWLGWADAIALSAALKGAPPAVPADRVPDEDGQDDYAKVRAALESAIAASNAPSVPRHRGQQRAALRAEARPPVQVDYATYRRRYRSLQQTMETSIASLRTRLRTTLAAMTPDMARLAVVDAAMEQTLGEREQYLLAGVPALLQKHFDRLQAAEQAVLAGDPAPQQAGANKPGAWLDVFCKDMQRVLLAELDIRLQPVEGLVSALRACQPRTL
ncbi:DUF3348 family protein [Allopusillimonas ginsengisoli]|nr:DUF3348 family protein [Allopusillimonas ginsengisoli]